MKFMTRPYSISCSAALVLIAWCLTPAPAARGQMWLSIMPAFADASAQATAAQGYLGIDVADVDANKAQALRLKSPHGAVITLIDHDAPAGQAGLRVNDVVEQLNGQSVDSAEQLRRELKEMPAGRRITLEISRDGAEQSVTVELVDRRAMEQSVWHRLGSGKSVTAPQMGFAGSNSVPGGFHFPGFGSALKVGALVEPLTSQMAAHLGVDSGLMVKQVAKKSAAAVAGLRAFDVILKVGADAIATTADWDRALRSNQGKSAQVTILRDKRQQTVTLQVDSKRHESGLEPENVFGPDDVKVLAENLREEMNSGEWQSMVAQAQALREQMRRQVAGNSFGLSQEQVELLRRQAEKLRESMKDVQLDPKQMEEMRQRMDELRREMEEWSARAFSA